MQPRAITILGILAGLTWAGRLEAGARAPGFVLPGLHRQTVKYDPPKKGAAGSSAPLVYVVFVLPGQEASDRVLREMAGVLKGAGKWPRKVRAIAIVGGQLDDAGREKLLEAAPKGGPVEMAHDQEDKINRAFGVIALPTTFVIAPDGTVVAALPGRSAAYPKRLREASLRALGVKIEVAQGKTHEELRAARMAHAAQQLLKKRRYAQAAEEMEKACAVLPKDPDLWVMLGDIYLVVPDAKAAAERFRKALAVAPKHKRALRGLAKANSLFAEDQKAAEKQLKKQIRRPPVDPGLRYYLGRLYERQGKTKEAMAAYRRAFEELQRVALRSRASR